MIEDRDQKICGGCNGQVLKATYWDDQARPLEKVKKVLVDQSNAWVFKARDASGSLMLEKADALRFEHLCGGGRPAAPPEPEDEKEKNWPR